MNKKVMIKNFILIYYTRDQLTEFEKINHDRYHKNLPKDFRLNIHKKLLNLSCSRIKELYPKSEIHLISNQKTELPVTHHIFENMEKQHTTKLLMYGLLNEPAMYIDNDVLLVRPFNINHLEVESPINPYNLNYRKIFTHKSIQYQYYSASVVYIKNPCKIMQQEMQNLHNEEFFLNNNTEKNDDHPLSMYNDEYSMSMYIQKNNFKIKLFTNEVNVGRMRIENENRKIQDFQSVHYSAPKHLFEPELAIIRKNEIKML
jgi:hypothetical protein